MCKTGLPGIDCATNNPDPYLGPVPIVTHVHGAHVDPHSDGYPEAWWLPAGVDASLYDTKGTLFDDATGINPGSTGYADYSYRNDQPATTLWYHDHSLGMTRANVYAGPAGFWLIRGGGFDKGKDSSTKKKAVLPGPAPVAGDTLGALNTPGNPLRNAIREIPIVIQDRSFNDDGELFYPASREFFDGFTGPYTPDFVTGGDMSDISPAWNPEAFFNVMVVNGVSWPTMDVAPARYRLRLLNGCNSRFLNLALHELDSEGNFVQEIPFYQIGADQGFLPQVVKIQTGEATPLPGATQLASDPDQALLMGLAERADVIVDFSQLADGAIVRMVNTAADAPFGGFNGAPGEDEVADPDTTGQVMQFMVKSALSLASDAMTTLPENLVMKAERSLDNRKIKVTRQISLNEGESETVCLNSVGASVDPDDPDCQEHVAPKEALLGTVSGSGTTATGIPLKWTDTSGISTPVQITMADGVTTKMINVTENPTLGHTEDWEIYNFTEDAHPIHLHLVRFEVIKRTAMDGTAGSNGSQQPWETGFKDTVIAYPGEITTVRAKFDVAGLFVWHCHILEHEDNEMMRPYVVSPEPKQKRQPKRKKK
jgi:FtsP/CotA-like multicopper oxidase with cupredoxin domain